MLKTKNIYLVRHGKVEGKPALNGSTDVLVATETQQQIKQALQAYPVEFDQVITSPLKRCYDVATLYSKDSNVGMSSDPRFQEMNFGDVDGVPFDDLTQQWNELEQFWQDPANHALSGAESLHSFRERVLSGWSHVLESSGDNILLVTHGGVIRALLAHALNIDWTNPSWYSNLSIANASITHIKITHADQDFISVKSIGLALL
ncbi:MAG: alpha-ribazole phosphatase family protein [Vibrio gallaecicus]